MTDKQTKFPLVNSTPSVEGVKWKTFSKALHRLNKNNTQPEMTNLWIPGTQPGWWVTPREGFVHCSQSLLVATVMFVHWCWMMSGPISPFFQIQWPYTCCHLAMHGRISRKISFVCRGSYIQTSYCENTAAWIDHPQFYLLQLRNWTFFRKLQNRCPGRFLGVLVVIFGTGRPKSCPLEPKSCPMM